MTIDTKVRTTHGGGAGTGFPASPPGPRIPTTQPRRRRIDRIDAGAKERLEIGG